MNKLKLASIVLAAVASTGLVFGSVGFSAVAADRGVSVSVASDENALVGYETYDQTITGDEVNLVTVSNRLPSSATVTDVDVSVASSDGTVDVTDIEKPGSIATGENGTVKATIDCKSGAEANLTVAVTVEGDGVTAEISGDTATRTFEVECAGQNPQPDVARFNGAGNFEFGATDAETVNVTYWTASKEQGDWTVGEPSDSVEVDPTTKLNDQVDGGPKFVAVYVHEFDTTYVHPNFDRDATPPIDDWGQGNQDADEEDGRYDPAE
jgi:hypothetical protein